MFFFFLIMRVSLPGLAAKKDHSAPTAPRIVATGEIEMAIKTWTGGSSNDWFAAANWNPLGVPSSADDVVIGSTARSPVVDASATVDAITIDGSDTLTLTGAATVLTVTNGITLSSTGGISGVGAVAASIMATGAAHIMATGGTLEVTGTITDSGAALTLDIAGAGDRLLLDGTSAANAVTFGSSGTLELSPSAALTVGTALALGAGTLRLDRLSALTDTSGATISTGTIVGFGHVTAPITATGDAHIVTSGGTLEISGPITDAGHALTLSVAGASDTLLLDNAGFGVIPTPEVHSVTFGSTGVLELGEGLAVDTTLSIGAGTVQLDSGPLSDAAGITIGSGTITGTGLITANITATGAAQIAATGILEINGSVTDSGNALTLVVGGGLTLDATSAAHSVTLMPSGLIGRGLSIGSSATLTVGTTLTIPSGGVGTNALVSIAGGTLNDPSGISFTIIGSPDNVNDGVILGNGVVNAALSGTGTITAVGGTLHLTGTVATGPTLTIADGSVLSIENTATAAGPITIDTSNETLAIGAKGNLTINGGGESITNGTILLSQGGQLSDGSGFTIGSGAGLVGAGKVTGAIGGSGIVEASGGTLELGGAISASDGTAFKIANSSLAGLLLDAAPGTGNTFTFLGAAGHLALANDAGFNGTVSGLNVGTAGARTNFIDIRGHTVVFSSVTGHGTTSGTIALSDDAVLHLSNLSSTAWFADAVGDGNGGTDIFVSDTALVPPPAALSFAVGVDKGSAGDTFTVTGQGETGDLVTLFDGITAIGTATVTPGGTWSMTTANPLAIGAHSLTAKEAQGANTSPASPPQSLTVKSATPNAVVFTGTDGADNFTGGAGNDVFFFTAATLSAGDKVVGGGGTDQLFLTGGGTFNVGGVSGVETVVLGNVAPNSLTLSNSNFTAVSGATITVLGGNASNTVDAAALTGPNRVVMVGGAGGNHFTGGAGNDMFRFVAGNLAKTDTVIGGGGFDTLTMTTPGLVNVSGVSGVNSIASPAVG